MTVFQYVRKKWLINILMLITTVVLSACGGGSNNNDTNGGNGGNGNQKYSISVNVTDASSIITPGNPLVLQNNGADDLNITAPGNYSFLTTVDDGAAYNVTVLTQPTAAQCNVTNGSGNVASANVSISVDCSAVTFNVGGTLNGLTNGASVELQLAPNVGTADTLSLNADGNFTFPNPLLDGSVFTVTVLSQPNGQSCTVANSTGTLNGADVTNISVNCVTGAILVSGQVFDDNDLPLTGVIVDARGATDDTVQTTAQSDANGNYQLAVMPGQDFYLHTKGGMVAGVDYIPLNLQIQNESGDRAGIEIFMVPRTVVSSVIGSGAIGTVDVANDALFYLEFLDANDNGVAGITVASTPNIANIWYDQDGNGTYSQTGPSTANSTPAILGFIANPGANATYQLTMSGNTSAIGIDTNLSLRLIPGELSGPIEGAGSLQSFSVTATVNDPASGLSVGNPVIIENNGNDPITVSASGSYTFSTQIVDGNNYNVSVATQPSGLTCSASNNTGTISGANVTNVQINCDTNTIQVGGNLSGLNGGESLVIQNNGGDDLTLTANGNFNFATLLANGSGYNVTVLTQPATQICNVTNGSGTVSSANGNVTDVSIVCSSSSFDVSGTVTGLVAGGSVVLQNNFTDNLTVNADSNFTFATQVPNGGSYEVTVLTQPTGQNCTVTNGVGVISGANVSNVSVLCSNINVTISGQAVDDSDVGIAGLTIEARNATTDAVLASTTTNGSGNYSLSVEANRDFYLYQAGGMVGGIDYYPLNLEIQNEQADRSGIRFFTISRGNVGGFIATTNLNGQINTTLDAIFAIEICNQPCINGDGVAGITAVATPTITNIYYDQDGSGTFSLTGPTTINNSPGILGSIPNPGSNATYDFVLTGPTSNLTISSTFKLRLMPGVLSGPIEN